MKAKFRKGRHNDEVAINLKGRCVGWIQMLRPGEWFWYGTEKPLRGINTANQPSTLEGCKKDVVVTLAWLEERK